MGEASAVCIGGAASWSTSGGEGTHDRDIAEKREASIGTTDVSAGSGNKVHAFVIAVSNGKVGIAKKPFGADAITGLSEDLPPWANRRRMPPVDAPHAHASAAVVTVNVESAAARSGLTVLPIQSNGQPEAAAEKALHGGVL